MFEKASKMKLRFNYKGLVSTEDLWDLSLQELDGIYKTLNKELKDAKEESLLDERSAADTIVDLKVAIVKHIVEVKKAEKAERENAKLEADQRKLVMSIIAEKKNEKLKSMSVEDLEKLL